jgi:predicted amidohydrolase
MVPRTWRIGLAAPRLAETREDGLAAVGRFLTEAAARGALIVCFPETYLPGYRGPVFPAPPPPPDQAAQERTLHEVCALAREHRVAVIMPMEWASPAGLLNLAFVVDADGTVQGYQTKNQIAPEEEAAYVPGVGRQLFEVAGVPFGIAICHEGWRYPETVRWAARRGAPIVFHPHVTGGDGRGVVPRFWGDPQAPYYEKAMVARAAENVIYFASSNYALTDQETATCVVAPDGRCVAQVPYGEEGLLVADLDLRAATRWAADRLAPERYGDVVQGAAGAALSGGGG